MSSKKGFTLIELSMVILVLGFLVILAKRVLVPSNIEVTYGKYYEDMEKIKEHIFMLARQNQLIQPFSGNMLYSTTKGDLGINYNIYTTYSGNSNIKSLCDMYQMNTTIGVNSTYGFKSVDIFIYPEAFRNEYDVEYSSFNSKVGTRINKVDIKFKRQPLLTPITISFNDLMMESNCANLQITPTVLPTDYQLSNYAIVNPGNYFIYPPWGRPSRGPTNVRTHKNIEMLFYSSRAQDVLWCAIDNQFVGSSTKGVSSYVATRRGTPLINQSVDPNINTLTSTGTFSYHISSSDTPDANVPHSPNYYPKEDLPYMSYNPASSLLKTKKLSGINIYATTNAATSRDPVLTEKDLLYCYDLYSPYKHFTFYNCNGEVHDCPQIGRNLKVSFAPRRLDYPSTPLMRDNYPNPFLDDVALYSGYGVKGSANFIVYIGYPVPNRNEDEYWDGSLYAIFQDRKLVSFVLW